MKSRHEFPIDGQSANNIIKTGEYLVVWDDDGGCGVIRIHLKTGTGYTNCAAHDFRVIKVDHSEQVIPETHPNFAKLEPFMNLMGTRETKNHLPAFIVTKEELENILGG